MRVTELACDAWLYFRSAFLRWWFLLYTGAIAAWEFIAGPAGLPELKPVHYLILAVGALVIGSPIAFIEKAREVRRLSDALSGVRPLLDPDFALIQQRSRLVTSEDQSLHNLPAHVSEVTLTVDRETDSSVHVSCDAPIYFAIGDYRGHNGHGDEYCMALARTVSQRQASFHFGVGPLPAGSLLRLQVFSPQSIAFRAISISRE